MKNIRIIALLILALSAQTTFAQFEDFEDEEKSTVKVNTDGTRKTDRSFMDKYAFGGSFGFGFSSQFGYIELVPFFGYRFNNYVTAGVTATYMYSYYSTSWSYEAFDSSVYGGGVFTDVYPFKFLVVHAEAQVLNFDNISDGYTLNFDNGREWDVPLIVGLGYHQSFNERCGINYMLLFNINDSNKLRYNVYSNPIVRITFVF
ncbi:MAG: hypothetical protein IKR94_01480 [Bacteroidales bacterium]|nr:hypothetical protein [Bacteroidales bacterium]MBR4213975.1 hypothetical protein [Bacteroidales bacterium]